MKYYDKVEAYFEERMNPMECQLFEQELAENTVLQEEVEAYKLAQSLFDFSAENISEDTLIEATAEDTADSLISFTAKHLSEAEILATPAAVTTTPILKVVEKPTKVRFLSPIFRKALAAASVLLVFGLFTFQLADNPNLEIRNGESGIVAVTEEILENTSTSILPSEPTVAETSATPEEKKTVQINEGAKKTPKKVRKYAPAKVKVRPSNANLAAAKPIPTMPTNQLAMNTVATEITTSAKIAKGQNVTYNAENITLGTGFTAEAGASFTATSNPKTIEKDVVLNEELTDATPTTYTASNSITFEAGFHAKAGSNFTAAPVCISSITKDIATNAIIANTEKVIVKAKGGSVTLTEGFHVKAGGDFQATVEK